MKQVAQLWQRPRELGDFTKARVNGGTNNHSLTTTTKPTTKTIYKSAIGRIKHESERCDGTEPS